MRRSVTGLSAPDPWQRPPTVSLDSREKEHFVREIAGLVSSGLTEGDGRLARTAFKSHPCQPRGWREVMPIATAKPLSILKMAAFGAVVGALYGFVRTYLGAGVTGADGLGSIVGGAIGGAESSPTARSRSAPEQEIR